VLANSASLAFYIGVIALILRALATKRLKVRHPKEWVRLGNPALIDQGSSDIGSIALTRFFLRGEFFKIQDTTLRFLCIAFNLAAMTTVLLMVATAISW
jgi:hypothetical protein